MKREIDNNSWIAGLSTISVHKLDTAREVIGGGGRLGLEWEYFEVPCVLTVKGI